MALSSDYWTLHRNSMLFSALALALSAPDIRIGSSPSYGIALVGPIGAKFIYILVAISAVYSFFVFYLEWRSQALPLLKADQRSAIDVTKSIEDNLKTTVKYYAQSIDNLNSLSTSLSQIAANPQAAQHNVVEPGFIDLSCRRVEESREGIENLRGIFEKLLQETSIKRVFFGIKIDQKTEVVRVLIIGLYVPLLIFIIALSHVIGNLFYSLIPFTFFTLLS